MSREANVKAVSAGLQPKSLDLTDFAPARGVTRVKSTMRVSNEDAAYAIGFSAADLIIDGELVSGAPLAAILLRIKYAKQLAFFGEAHEKLLHSYGGISGNPKRPDVTALVARAALLEWLQDSCPKCRGAETGRVEARPCKECPQRRAREPWEVDGRREAGDPYRDPWGETYRDRQGHVIVRTWMSSSPAPGCVKCGGMGRIFSAPKESRGIRCIPCNSTGRISYKYRRRFRLVNEMVVDAAIARGEKFPKGLRLDSFSYWERRYLHFLDVLRSIDRQMGAGIDFGVHASNIRLIEPAREEKQDAAEAESADGNAVGQPTAHEPEEPTGPVPPEES